jgi:tetratricopeptide (TPR) repeat protein
MMLAALFCLLLQADPVLLRHVNAGLAAKKAGDLKTAEREFQEVVRLAPDLPAAHVNLGAVYFEQKEYVKAISPLRRALELNSKLPGAAAMLGASLLAAGYAQQAVPHLRESGNEDLLAVALYESGETVEAVERLEAALQRRPGDPDLLYYLSQAHSRLAKLVGARLLETGSARAHQLRGEALAEAGRRDLAREEFLAALRQRPDLRGIHLALGELYLADGDYNAAQAEFEQEKTLAPGNPAARFRLGSVLLEKGEVAAARTELQEADRLRPDMPETLYALGKASALAGDPTAAENALRRVTEIEKNGPLAQGAWLQLSHIYKTLNKPAEAEQALREFQRLRATGR